MNCRYCGTEVDNTRKTCKSCNGAYLYSNAAKVYDFLELGHYLVYPKMFKPGSIIYVGSTKRGDW